MPSEPHIAQSSCYSVAVMEPGYGWVLGEGRVSVSFVRVTQPELICLNLGLKEQYKSIKHANIFLLPPKETCFDMIPLFGLAGLAVLVKWKRFWRENMESDFNFLMKFFYCSLYLQRELAKGEFFLFNQFLILVTHCSNKNLRLLVCPPLPIRYFYTYWD